MSAIGTTANAASALQTGEIHVHFEEGKDTPKKKFQSGTIGPAAARALFRNMPAEASPDGKQKGSPRVINVRPAPLNRSEIQSPRPPGLDK